MEVGQEPDPTGKPIKVDHIKDGSEPEHFDNKNKTDRSHEIFLRAAGGTTCK
jgi:hypothetical protein